MSGFSHRAVLFESVEEQAEVLAPVIEQALAGGRPVFAVLDTPYVDALHHRLGARSADVDGLSVRHPTDVYRHPARALAEFVELVRTHTADGREIVLVGEASFDSQAMDHRLWAQAESVLNAALGSRPVSILCAYHCRDRPREYVDSAGRTHREVHVDGGWQVSDSYLEPAEYLARHQALPTTAPAHARSLPIDAPGDLRRARREIAGVAIDAGLSAERAEDLVMASSEVATNAVEHGLGPRSLLVWTEPGAVWCEVVNAGAFTDPLRGFVPPEPHQSRGRGVFVARQLYDGLQIEVDDRRVRVQAWMARPR